MIYDMMYFFDWKCSVCSPANFLFGDFRCNSFYGVQKGLWRNINGISRNISDVNIDVQCICEYQWKGLYLSMDNGNKTGDVMVYKPLMIDPNFVWLYNSHCWCLWIGIILRYTKFPGILCIPSGFKHGVLENIPLCSMIFPSRNPPEKSWGCPMIFPRVSTGDLGLPSGLSQFDWKITICFFFLGKSCVNQLFLWAMASMLQTVKLLEAISHWFATVLSNKWPMSEMFTFCMGSRGKTRSRSLTLWLHSYGTWPIYRWSKCWFAY